MKKCGVGVGAICLLVFLRMAIGWQFLYEGLWKLHSLNTAESWTSAGYLKNAQGPLRPFFRSLTGDPDDLNWLDVDSVAARWDRWYQRFVAHYQLDAQQKQSLSVILNGSKAYYARLDELPAGVEFRGSLGKAISYDAANKRLVVDGKRHLTPQERDRLLDMVTVQKEPAEADKAQNELAKAFQKAVADVYARSSRPAGAGVVGMSFKERLGAMLKGDPEVAGVIQPEQKGTIDYKRIGEIEQYEHQLKRHEQKLAGADVAYEFDHLKKQWGDAQALRAKLVGPVKGLDAELKEEALKLLTAAQFARGPVSALESPIISPQVWIDRITMWSLTILGACLIAGLFTRLAALGIGAWFVMFYLAMPPWPGVPQPPSPDHSLFVNKLLIEGLAVLTIAALPTGQWFGMDALIRRLLAGKKAGTKKGVRLR